SAGEMTSYGGQTTAPRSTRVVSKRSPRNGLTSAMSQMPSTRSPAGAEPPPPPPGRRRRTVRLAARPRAGRGVYQGGGPGKPPEDEDWGTIARIYDLEHPACRGPELAFWDDLATAAAGNGGASGGVLELAAGTGRIAVALARKGHLVTGLELSAGML